MIPIYIDFVISMIATLAGLGVLIYKVSIFRKDCYSPLQLSMMLLAGVLGWSIFALLSYASIAKISGWMGQPIAWTGSWSYTVARLLLFVAWVMLLFGVCRRNDRAKRLQKRLQKLNIHKGLKYDKL